MACKLAFGSARLLAEDLLDLGINTNCAPVADVPVAGSHDIIGDRAYGRSPHQVAALGDLNGRLQQVSKGQFAKAIAQGHPSTDRARHRD